MPGVYCAVYGCLNSASSKPELSYFKLPADVERRTKWLRLISREDLMNKSPQNYTVCEDHFDAMDILPGMHRKKLKARSLPSLHLPVIHKKEAPMLVDICTQTEEIESTSTAQHVPSPSQDPSSSQEHQDQDPNPGCSNADDIPLDLEIFEESTIEKPTYKIEDTTENTEKVDAGYIEKPITSKKRTRKPQTIPGEKTTTRQFRPEIGGIKINFSNIDKFGEQITFILKRIPKKLCRELQDTIVTLVKTATEKHESKIKKSVPSNTKKVKTPISRTENDSKRKKSKQLVNQEESVSIDSISDVIMEEYTQGETAQATELLEEQLGTTPDQRFASRVRTIDTFPKPMTLPIELMGSMDCVKQEVLDPEDSNDSIIDPEQYNEATTLKHTLFDPLKTNIKIDIDETNLIEQAKRIENSQDKYV